MCGEGEWGLRSRSGHLTLPRKRLSRKRKLQHDRRSQRLYFTITDPARHCCSVRDLASREEMWIQSPEIVARVPAKSGSRTCTHCLHCSVSALGIRELKKKADKILAIYIQFTF